MTDLDKFIQDAIRTESVVDDLNIDFIFLKRLMKSLINMGNVLDQVKKHAFYGKDYQPNIRELLEDTQNQISAILNDDKDIETLSFGIINPRVFHGIVGIATESTELLEAIFAVIYEKKQLDGVNVGEELGDVDWYKAILCDELGLSWDNSLETVIAKLKVRFPDKFTSEDAIDRDLDTERSLLEDRLDGEE